jgi:hypothetical protein
MASGTSPSPSTFAALRDLAREHPIAVTVRGGCMAPLLADGERVEVATARVYLPGDVVVFLAADGRLLVHRLLGWRLWAGAVAWVTRGDGCPCHDAPVPRSRVLGRVVEPRQVRAAAADRLRAVMSYLLLAAGRMGGRR